MDEAVARADRETPPTAPHIDHAEKIAVLAATPSATVIRR